MPDAVEQRWIHDEKRRYYGVFLQQDLFGDWTLVRNWGSLEWHLLKLLGMAIFPNIFSNNGSGFRKSWKWFGSSL